MVGELRPLTVAERREEEKEWICREEEREGMDLVVGSMLKDGEKNWREIERNSGERWRERKRKRGEMGRGGET